MFKNEHFCLSVSLFYHHSYRFSSNQKRSEEFRMYVKTIQNQRFPSVIATHPNYLQECSKKYVGSYHSQKFLILLLLQILILFIWPNQPISQHSFEHLQSLGYVTLYKNYYLYLAICSCSSWSSWNKCSKSCGGGKQKRERFCGLCKPTANCECLDSDDVLQGYPYRA